MKAAWSLGIVMSGMSRWVCARGAEVAPESLATGSVLQMIFGLGVVLLILIGGAWALRRFGHLPNSADSPLRIVTGISLGPRDRIAIVQVGEKQIMVGISPGRIQTLYVLEQPLDIQNPPGQLGSLGKKFGELLQHQLKK